MTGVGNWLAAQFLGGTAFFVGMVMVMIVVLLRLRYRGLAINLLLWSSLLVVVGAAVPQPLWIYAFWGLSLTGVIFVPVVKKRMVWATSVVVLLLSLILVALEIPYHLNPRIPVVERSGMCVVGDSLSLGAPPGSNWPELLADKLGLPGHNYSTPGAKTEAALQNARCIDANITLVLLEIGGNDLLGGTKDLKPSLDRILKEVCKSGRQVVMLELPLPPFFNHFGQVQRELAKQYGVILIPRKHLVRVLATPDATVDGLHLSVKGHKLLADALFSFFG